MNAARCGMCVRVTGAAGTEVLLVDDVCPSCPDDDLDLDLDAFAAVTGAVDGRLPITWQYVPCEPPGNAMYDFQGSNNFYIKIRISQTTTPVASVEIMRSSGFAEATRTFDGFFELTAGEMLPSTLMVRVTDTFGSTIEFTTPDLANNVLRDAGAQFPTMCAP